jgi:hypothetical protein
MFLHNQNNRISNLYGFLKSIINKAKTSCDCMNSKKQNLPPRKYIIKCLRCDKELKGINNPDFSKDHLIDNPTHLEYKVFVEILSTTAATSKFP